jgi:hypothetical protein
MQSGLLLNIVVAKSAAIFKLCATIHQTFLSSERPCRNMDAFDVSMTAERG